MFVCLLCGANPDWQSKNYSQAILTDFLFDWQPPEKSDWGTGLEAMQSALELEKHVNQALLDLHKIADSHGDAQMCDFIEANYLTEQVSNLEKFNDKLLIKLYLRCVRIVQWSFISGKFIDPMLKAVYEVLTKDDLECVFAVWQGSCLQ